VHVDRYAAAVVLDRAAPINMNANRNCIASAGKGFVNRVVQNLINKMVQAALLTVAYVHLRPFAHSLKARKNLYVAGIVTMVFHISVLLPLI
jgi:hypothetical protein